MTAVTTSKEERAQKGGDERLCGWELVMDMESSGTVKVQKIGGDGGELCLVLPFRPDEGVRGQVSLSLPDSAVSVTGGTVLLENGSVRWVVEKRHGVAEIRRVCGGVEKGSLILPFQPESGGGSPVDVNLPDMKVKIAGGKIRLTDVL